MKIAVFGPGAIGSTFAYQLATAGHDVTVVARGARLARLRADGAIVKTSGERAAVSVADALDPGVPWDLVLVTVLAPQVAPLRPALRASAARKVMFMFNTFESLDPLRDAVGEARFAMGFPGGVFSILKDGRITPQIRGGTTVGDREWAEVFSGAGIPTVVEPDMQSWLRTHAALVFPLMAIGVLALGRGTGVTWREAAAHHAALAAGVAIVRASGARLLPHRLGTMLGLPGPLWTAALWIFSRTKMARELGELGATEPRMLADMMTAASPELAGPVAKVRP